MKWKTEKIKSEWETPIDKVPAGRQQGWTFLKSFIRVLDEISVLLGFGEITITDLLRKPNPAKPSYHAVWQGGDIRSKDKPLAWKVFMVSFGYLLSATNWRFQIYPHFESWGKANEHLHIAVRIGKKG